MDGWIHAAASFCYGGLVASWLKQQKVKRSHNAATPRSAQNREDGSHQVRRQELLSQLREPFFLMSFALRGVLLHAVLAQFATLQVDMSGTSSMGTMHVAFMALRAGVAAWGFVWPMVDPGGYRQHHHMLHDSALSVQAVAQAFRVICTYSPKRVQLLQTVIQGMLIVVHQDAWQAAAVQLCFINLLQVLVVVLNALNNSSQQGYSQEALISHLVQAVVVVLLLWLHRVQPLGEREELVAVEVEEAEDTSGSYLQQMAAKLSRQLGMRVSQQLSSSPSTPVSLAPYMKRAQILHTATAFAGLFKAVQTVVSIRRGTCTFSEKWPSVVFKFLMNPLLFAVEIYSFVSPSGYVSRVTSLHMFCQLGFHASSWLPVFIEGPSVNDPQQIKIFIAGLFASAFLETDLVGTGKAKLLMLKLGLTSGLYLAAAFRWEGVHQQEGWRVVDVATFAGITSAALMALYTVLSWLTSQGDQQTTSQSSQARWQYRWVPRAGRRATAVLKQVFPHGVWIHAELKSVLWDGCAHPAVRLVTAIMVGHQLCVVMLLGGFLGIGADTGVALTMSVVVRLLLLASILYAAGAFLSYKTRGMSESNRRQAARVVILYLAGPLIRLCAMSHHKIALLDNSIRGSLAATLSIPLKQHLVMYIPGFLITKLAAFIRLTSGHVAGGEDTNKAVYYIIRLLCQQLLGSSIAYIMAYLPAWVCQRMSGGQEAQESHKGWVVHSLQVSQLVLLYVWHMGGMLAVQTCGDGEYEVLHICHSQGHSPFLRMVSFLANNALWTTLTAVVIIILSLLPLLAANHRKQYEQYNQLQWYNRQQGRLTVASVEAVSRVGESTSLSVVLDPLTQLIESAYTPHSVYFIMEASSFQSKMNELNVCQSGRLAVSAEEVSRALTPHAPTLAQLDQCVCFDNTDLHTFALERWPNSEAVIQQQAVQQLMTEINELWSPKVWVSCPLRAGAHYLGSLLVVADDAAAVDSFFCRFTCNLAQQLAHVMNLHRSMQDVQASNTLLTDILPSSVADKLKKKMFRRHTTECLHSHASSPVLSSTPTATNKRPMSCTDSSDSARTDGQSAVTPVHNNSSTQSSSNTSAVDSNCVAGMGNADVRCSVPLLQEWHGNVSVLFADIVGYTSMSHSMEPEQVMSMLHALFSKFDLLCNDWGVYKVETIGDCYVACTGLIQESSTHASDLVLFACDMLAAAASTVCPTGQQVCLRVGIHSGKVMSGVVGAIRSRYCLFGETVNRAARMESTGIPLSIQVSDTTYDLLLPELQSQFTPRDLSDTHVAKCGRSYLWQQPNLTALATVPRRRRRSHSAANSSPLGVKKYEAPASERR